MTKDSIFYSWIKVYSRLTDLPVTGLVNGDFTKTLILNNAIAVEIVTVTEVDSVNRPGLYSVSWTPLSSGFYRCEIELDISLYTPSEFKIEEVSYDPGASVTIPTTALTGILADLVTSLRLITNDVVGSDSNKLWSDVEWVEYLNDAEREICRRAHVLKDYSTSAVCEIALVTDTASYTLHSKVLRIESAFINYASDSKYEVVKRTKRWLDENRSGWRTLASSLPEFFVEEEGKIVFVPAPSSTYNGKTVTLTVSRLPVSDLSASNTTPAIHARHYDDMKLWALYRAYMKGDSQAFHPDVAKTYYDAFENNVGSRLTTVQERVAKEEPEGIIISPYRGY